MSNFWNMTPITPWIPLSDYRQLPDLASVYLIRDCDGRQYVGKSVNLHLRLRIHCNASKQQRLHRAIKSLGLERFEVCVLIHSSDPAVLLTTEINAIATLGTYGKGYNDTRGGDGGWEGRKHSLESRQKMSEAQLTRSNKNYPSRKGYMPTAETRARMSAAALKREELARSSRPPKKARAPSPGRPKRAVELVRDDFRKVFTSIAEAAVWAGVSKPSVRNWCNLLPMSEEFQHLGVFRYLK